MEHGNFQINIANNGQDALTLLEKIKPDLILLDIMMPIMDGLETCKIIKQDETLKHIPIIFLTAKNDKEDLAEAFRLGAADFVSKPFNTLELVARVKTHLELKVSRDLLKTRLEGLVHERTEQLEIEIREKLKFKEQLMQSQKMEAIGQLAGGVAHDFNNQLGGIIGSAELIRHRTDNEKILKYTDMILRAAQSSANLTKQLLAFARKGKETTCPVDINTMIIEVTKLLKRSLNKNIDIVHDFDGINAYTTGDHSLLENSILNMAINAGHAMPGGGTLTFSTSIEEMDSPAGALSPGSYLKLVIRDTGNGMSEEVQQRIFEPFFTTKGKDKGTGLGLSATYGTIQQHNGHISVNSKLDQGTAFTVLLPANKKATLSIENTLDTLTDIRSTRVLIIDDEEIILETVSELLEALGCKVKTSNNGADGVEIYKANPSSFDIVILDKIMPGMGGKEVYIELKKINPKIKTVLASGYSNEQAQDILDLGVSGFIRKPYTMAALSKLLSEICGNK